MAARYQGTVRCSPCAHHVIASPPLPPPQRPDDASNFDSYEHLPPLESGAGLSGVQQAAFAPFSEPLQK